MIISCTQILHLCLHEIFILMEAFLKAIFKTTCKEKLKEGCCISNWVRRAVLKKFNIIHLDQLYIILTNGNLLTHLRIKIQKFEIT